MVTKSSYPSQIDSDIELPRVDDNITEIGGDAINSLRDAIFSVEQAIGTNPQGNLSDFVTRINRVIDADGNIKASALSQIGLVTLPIADIHVGANAGIKESKLDLDYSTSYLNGKISGSATDTESLRTSLNSFISRVLYHFSGAGDKHDGYDIDLNSVIRGAADVETALHILSNVLSDHEASVETTHPASSISTIDRFVNFSADDVQTALEELDEIGVGEMESHRGLLHKNGISLNTDGTQGDNGNVPETACASTIFQTDIAKATNILQVMRPNVARVTGGHIDFGALSVGYAQYLRIQAGGIGRSYIDVNLSSIIPTTSIDEIVEAINQAAHDYSTHYPISAYNTDGRITIAHNIPGEDFTIQILDSVQFSAATVLGFADITSTEFSWAINNQGVYIGGKLIRDTKSLIKMHYTHSSSPLNQISPGLGDLSAYGMSTGNEGRILCNITNHSSNSDDNGTHYITSFPTSQSFTLSSDIQTGSFDIEIPADAVNFENSARGEIHDIFIEDAGDGYGKVIKNLRASYVTISGINLIAISNDFPTNNMSWEITGSNQVQISEGNTDGISVDIPSGYVGTLKVYAPDNFNSAIFDITGSPSSASRSITMYDFGGDSDTLHLSSIHYSGNYGIYRLKNVVDKRSLSGTIDPVSMDTLNPIDSDDSLRELRNNGVIRGLDVVSFDSDSIRVRGGRVLVEGRIINIETQDITVGEFDAARRALLVDKHGNFVIKSEFDSGFSFSELISGDAYGDNREVAIIAEFETDGSTIDGYVYDRRLMVNKIDKKLIDTEDRLTSQITDIRNVVSGSMWGFVVASSSDDGYLASIEVGANNGFSYIPSGSGWWDQSADDAHGFLGGRTLITTRVFEFSDSSTIANSLFRAPGLTHINVFVEATYTGNNGGPLGVDGTSYIEIGLAAETGMSSPTISSDYAIVKTLYTGVLPSTSVTERYVVSVPTSQLSLSDNIIFSAVPRVRITNSNYVNGGSGDDAEPMIEFGNIRIVTSSYSIAGMINEEDGSSESLFALVGDVL